MDSNLLKARTKKFAVQVLNFLDEIPQNRKGYIVSNQLGRCATSVGANYRAACRAKSMPDFISKIQTVEEEADESCFWLEIIKEANILTSPTTDLLLKEANELTAIFVASGKSAKINQSKSKK